MGWRRGRTWWWWGGIAACSRPWRGCSGWRVKHWAGAPGQSGGRPGQPVVNQIVSRVSQVVDQSWSFCHDSPTVLPLFSWRPTYRGCVFSPTFPYRSNYKLQCSTFCAAPVCRSRVTRRVLSGAKDHGDFLKRGGVKTFTSTPPPLDIVRVTSPALRKIEKRPHSWTFTSTPPPWTLPVWRHPYSSGTLYIVTLCGYITSSTVLCCEGRKEPRHGSLRIIFFSPHWKHWIYLGLPTNPHNMVIFPVDLGFPYNLLNIPTNPHNMVIFPVGFPYNLQRAKSPYCRGIPLRVATLLPELMETGVFIAGERRRSAIWWQTLANSAGLKGIPCFYWLKLAGLNSQLL